MLKGERRGGRSAIRMHFSGGLSKAGWENAKTNGSSMTNTPTFFNLCCSKASILQWLNSISGAVVETQSDHQWNKLIAAWVLRLFIRREPSKNFPNRLPSFLLFSSLQDAVLFHFTSSFNFVFNFSFLDLHSSPSSHSKIGPYSLSNFSLCTRSCFRWNSRHCFKYDSQTFQSCQNS